MTTIRKPRGRPFQRGNSGRPAGSKNRTTQLLEQLAEGEAEPARKKYRNQEEEALAESRRQLSAAETQALARLVRKYGIRTVIALAKVVPLRGPGRPSRGLLPYYERMHRTEWIEEQAEEHRKRGSTKPYTDAEIDVYEMLFGEEKLRDIDKFRKTIKKMRQQGRQDLIDLLRAMLKAPLNKGRRDLIEKLRHFQRQARPYRGRK